MRKNHQILKDLFILASASPRRRALLKQWQIPYKAIASQVRELTQKETTYLTPRELAQANAFLKAKSVAEKYPKKWILGVDTIVVFEGKVFGKPKDLSEAYTMLTQLKGQTHQVISGLVFIKKGTYLQSHMSCETSWVTFKKVTSKKIKAYLAKVDVLDKAGAYAAQEMGSWLIQSIQGSLSNVIGLPKEKTLELLNQIKS